MMNGLAVSRQDALQKMDAIGHPKLKILGGNYFQCFPKYINIFEMKYTVASIFNIITHLTF